VTATDGFVSLGDAFDLWDADMSGWTYPTFRTEQRMIGNGVDAGNEVVQEGSKPYRTRTLAFTAQTAAQRDLVRGYFEDGSLISLVDYDTTACTVLVMEYSSADAGADTHRVTVRLLQLTEPA
jgi:hypothetical protein